MIKVELGGHKILIYRAESGRGRGPRVPKKGNGLGFLALLVSEKLKRGVEPSQVAEP
jgi:hypothetical protein